MEDTHTATPRNSQYFDHNATTPVAEDVIEVMQDLVRAWGNPSSIHWASRLPKNILRETRSHLAKNLGSHPLELIFTSGGSEANNTVLKGVFETSTRKHFMCSMVEHPSVIKTMQHLQTLGARVDFIPVSRRGEIDLEFYQQHLNQDTALVSVMFANNETGTLFPIQKMAMMAHAVGALFHTDAVQAFGKAKVNLQDLGVDFASFSAHKFYALKGCGVLYARKGTSLPSLIDGGGQERHRRGGTENIPGIGALGVMAKKLSEVEWRHFEISRLRDLMEAKILGSISHVSITARESLRLPNTSSLVIQGVDGETLLMSLDIKGYAVSTGAACSSGNPEPSPVLLAMGLSREEAQSSLRLSLGWSNTEEQILEFVDVLQQVVMRLRGLSGFQQPNSSEVGVSQNV